MSLGTSNRDGGKTSESGHLRALPKAFDGDVLQGLGVSQRGAGANMSVDVAVGDAFVRRSDGSYAHPVFNDAVYNQVIAAADGSNPRRDLIVIYVDYGQAPSTSVSNNINGVVKIKAVTGTPAGSPVDPNSTAIQSSVGAGNPYTILARVRVPAGQTSITNTLVDDLRKLTQPIPQGGWIYDLTYTWVYASSTTFTIAGVDARAQFPLGTKLALIQSGSLKYFIVTGSAFSTNTTITVDGLGAYTLANALIERPQYSYAEHPSGFPTLVLPYNPYKFSVYRAGAYTGAGATPLVMDTKLFDTNNNFNTSNGLYTVPAAGYYYFHSQITQATGTISYMWATIFKNGVEIRRGNRTSYNPSNGLGVWVMGFLQLNAGDTISFGYAVNASVVLEVADQLKTFAEGWMVSHR